MRQQSKDLNTAVRATYLLYRRGKWSHLEELGLNRKDHCDALDNASDDIGTVPTDQEIAQLVLACPFMLDAAQSMLVLLALLTRNSVK